MIGIIIVVVLLCFLLVSLFVRRHGESAQPRANWRRTDEVFEDPSTNRVMRVWLDASDERHYVPEDPPVPL